ncbi:F0F1 ATP synthase subunit epsilon [Halomicronema sp. CCY15110]|uniref:F0F1 ATP synthase subunit epsilon n=1 Tax=Halomicronema sp. CCY15110 TaxID=2767773 RepID=UPI00194ED366|nr:F0F1 ATP synthase subunit epsilon [Halomicronema sp. CCY15110]
MADSFDLSIFLPNRVLLTTRAQRLGADAENGRFVVRPNHIDFVTALVPSILYYQEPAATHYVAIDRGMLVKRENEVRVSVLQAIQSDDLEHLDHVIEKEFRALDERQKQTQTALTRLEVSFMRGMMDIGRASREF